MQRIIVGMISFLPTILWAENPVHGFLPSNNLHLEMQEGAGGIDEESFNDVLDQMMHHYGDVVGGFGATLKINRYWDDDTVNASAMQTGDKWELNMYGGLARRVEVTADGFAMVVCHELGHHLGGVVFYDGEEPWAASEGQSDYFATVSCAKKIWADQPVENATFEEKISEFQGGDLIKSKCDEVYMNVADRHLCYRTVVAGKSLGDLLSALGRAGVPQFDTPDLSKVDATSRSHPAGQCRLDTYIAGALCPTRWSDSIIPGKLSANRNSLKAFISAKRFACHSYHDPQGFRPRCWFNPRDIELPGTDTLISESEANLGPKESVELDPIEVQEGDIMVVEIKGTGDADLYARFGQKPSEGDFDCRPFRPDSNERCVLKVPENTSQIFAHVIGYGDESQISISTLSRESSKLCRDYNEGVGESFECYDGYSCKLTDLGDPKDKSTWCIEY